MFMSNKVLMLGCCVNGPEKYVVTVIAGKDSEVCNRLIFCITTPI